MNKPVFDIVEELRLSQIADENSRTADEKQSTPVSANLVHETKLKRVVIHVYAKKNNTFINVTDITGAERLFSHSGGLMAKKGRDKSGQKVALQAWQKMSQNLESKNITNAIIKFRNKGGVYSKLKTIALKTLLKNPPRELMIDGIYNVTPNAHGEIRKKGGRRGRRT